MLEFKKVEAQDVKVMEQYLRHQEFRSCDFTVGAIFMWRDFFYSEYAVYDDMLIFKIAYPKRGISFTFPVGEGSTDKALDAIEEYVRANNIPLKLCTMPEKAMEFVKFRYKKKAEFITNRDWYDYIYKAEDLKHFKGKKYHRQRNHVNRFIRENPNHSYARIDENNIDKVKQFFDDRFLPSDEAGKTERREAMRAREYLDNFYKFGHFGGVLEVEGEVVAFSLGEIIKDTLYIHVERANIEYHGTYQMIVREFARDCATEEILYLNREDDVGDPGLRKSKLAYRPIKLLKKYCSDIEFAE